MTRVVRTATALAACTVLGSSMAYAQATRTWVSGVGDDANPCSRTAPCKTFAGAISKTATGGEISVLDPGGYGGVTITKSITISGEGTLASALVAGTNAIVINAPAGHVVTLRNISIIGVGTGLNGIRFIGGSQLTVDHVDISGFTQSAIDIEPSMAAKVMISNCSLRTSTTGVQVSSPSGRVDVMINNTQIKGTVNGIDGLGGFTNVLNSVITQASGVAILGQGGGINVENSMITGNGVGVQAGGGAIRLSNNGIYDNLTGFGCGAGILSSTGDNRKANNQGGALPACVPNAVTTVQ